MRMLTGRREIGPDTGFLQRGQRVKSALFSVPKVESLQRVE